MKITFRERNPIVIGIASLIGLGLLLALAFNLNKLPFIASNYTIQAEFADAAGLSQGNEVRVAGIKVGNVIAIELAKDRVLVTMEVSDEVRIPREATAEISLKTLLGTKFVSIDAKKPGRPLEEGDTIPLELTKIPFEIYQASNSGVALLEEIDAEKLNESFRALATVADDPERNLARTAEGAAAVTTALASQADALGSLLQRGDELVATLDESSPDIQRLLTHGNEALEVLARRRATVSSLLRNTDLLMRSFGGLLKDNRSQINALLRDLHATLLIVDRNLAELEEAIRLLGPSSESLARITHNGRWASICIYSIEPIGTTVGPPADCGP